MNVLSLHLSRTFGFCVPIGSFHILSLQHVFLDTTRGAGVGVYRLFIFCFVFSFGYNESGQVGGNLI